MYMLGCFDLTVRYVYSHFVITVLCFFDISVSSDYRSRINANIMTTLTWFLIMLHSYLVPLCRFSV